jgi:SAM-dependent methyltransferase
MPSSQLVDRLERLLSARWRFTLSYLRGITPWDTNITPPELVRVVEGTGPEHLPPGRALDLGCGTGTNVLYLAAHGWDATGIDFAAPAIAQANGKRARQSTLPGTVHFVRGDVTRLGALDLRAPFDLVFDLGCFHALPADARPAYVSGATRLSRPDARFLLYAFAPTDVRGRQMGIMPAELRSLFAPGWAVERMETGQDRGERVSSWYWLQRASA